MPLVSIMYHYIESEQKYASGIFPTAPERLESQLKILREKNYEILSQEMLVSALEGTGVLKEKSCVLTFDDGLKSQYENALPILEKYNAPALFFVPTQHFTDKKAYLVHKIHFLLSVVDARELLESIEKEYFQKEGKKIEWNQIDLPKVMGWYRYDNEHSAKFKFLVNHFLDVEIVETLLQTIFLRVYKKSEESFCDSMYINEKELLDLHKHPLIDIGLHTHTHINIPASSAQKVYGDIKQCFDVLESRLGMGTQKGLSYPFGSMTEEMYTEKVAEATKNLHLRYGFTTEKVVNTDFTHPFTLGRFGANDVTFGKRPIFEL